MKDIRFRVWHIKDKKMYYRGYQKFFYVLLCDDDFGARDGRGTPVKRAWYKESVFLESTGLYDKRQKEIYEGDFVRVGHKGHFFSGLVDAVPDMFGTSKIHPLQSVLKKNGISGNPENLDLEVIGNEYENPEMLEQIQ